MGVWGGFCCSAQYGRGQGGRGGTHTHTHRRTHTHTEENTHTHRNTHSGTHAHTHTQERTREHKSVKFQAIPEACACLHANFGEAWRSLANPQRHIQDKLPDIHQSSGEGRPGSPEFRRRCLLYEGGLRNVPKLNESFSHDKNLQDKNGK